MDDIPSITLLDVEVTPNEDTSKYMVQPGGQGNNYSVSFNQLWNLHPVDHIPEFNDPTFPNVGPIQQPQSVPPDTGLRNYLNRSLEGLQGLGSGIGGAFTGTAKNYLQEYNTLTGRETEANIPQMELGDAASFIAQHVLPIPGGAGVMGAGPVLKSTTTLGTSPKLTGDSLSILKQYQNLDNSISSNTVGTTNLYRGIGNWENIHNVLGDNPEGKIISFPEYLSTSKDRRVAVNFSNENSEYNSKLGPGLINIKLADPN